MTQSPPQRSPSSRPDSSHPLPPPPQSATTTTTAQNPVPAPPQAQKTHYQEDRSRQRLTATMEHCQDHRSPTLPTARNRLHQHHQYLTGKVALLSVAASDRVGLIPPALIPCSQRAVLVHSILHGPPASTHRSAERRRLAHSRVGPARSVRTYCVRCPSFARPVCLRVPLVPHRADLHHAPAPTALPTRCLALGWSVLSHSATASDVASPQRVGQPPLQLWHARALR
ncbi:Uncharacterised protein [Mycobacteroides abscessus subsp. abscessus]|jgi:hypothetical protein|uniref:Uncharacterized protein n=1 Tax=Mycolicibacterium conceptionense TaxID=451644 RepID=A0A0U1CYB1_9MYCO|nr:Uncharacterised protein [Mycobacteroides abscessus]CQD04532.1 hypothetical protein BN970_00756 [Mycolicibacterium conceptionense]SHS16883.1 Uncharacterised protein [Mycobacteroides abscessus subsp. abscessus]CPR56868.1 Uncharacterised protein [Mycobacteroides abscessus]CPS22563.1 Uncharacterised protein [Mycobacteroides abscessus]